MLENLNPKQLEAVQLLKGPLLILAGAGTGKTKVLTSRIANLILSNTAVQDEILAVTFTNKAAAEMRERIELLIGNTGGMWIGTFHSIGLRLLKMHAAAVSLQPNFVIIDEADKNKLVKQIALELEIDEKRYPIKLLSFIISSIKERGVSHSEADRISGFKYKDLDVVSFYSLYQQRLRNYNLVDFDDLILQAINLLSSNSNILNDIHERFKYILVDEYQDTGFSQHKLLKILASKHNNICCVGDDDQSIYSWRGAVIENILNFNRDYSDANIIHLEQNYRSTAHILQTALGLIGFNKSRYNKSLHSTIEEGDKVQIVSLSDGNQEGNFIANKIKKMVPNEYKYSDIAVLVRASYQIRALEETLINYGIPYRIVDGTKFYDRREIKDIIAYLRLLQSDMDMLALERIINVPKRGIGEKTMDQLVNYAKSNNVNIIEALRQSVKLQLLSKSISEKIADLLEKIDKWRYLLADERYSLASLTQIIIQDSGYASMVEEESKTDPKNANRFDNLKELVGAMEKFTTLSEFLEHVALFNTYTDNANGEQINIFTMHGAKGLEFDVVFLPGWEETVFPSYRSIEENGDMGLEEERRLAYVAITRAKKRLFISYAQSRYLFGKQQFAARSRFIDEIIKANEDNIVYDNRLTDTSSQILDSPYSSGVKSLGNGYNSYNKYYNKGHAKANYSFKSSIIRNNNVNTKTNESVVMVMEIGSEVEHESFGVGEIVGTISQYYQVKFKKDGVKRLIQKDYLQLVKK